MEKKKKLISKLGDDDHRYILLMMKIFLAVRLKAES